MVRKRSDRVWIRPRVVHGRDVWQLVTVSDGSRATRIYPSREEAERQRRIVEAALKAGTLDAPATWAEAVDAFLRPIGPDGTCGSVRTDAHRCTFVFVGLPGRPAGFAVSSAATLVWADPIDRHDEAVRRQDRLGPEPSLEVAPVASRPPHRRLVECVRRAVAGAAPRSVDDGGRERIERDPPLAGAGQRVTRAAAPRRHRSGRRRPLVVDQELVGVRDARAGDEQLMDAGNDALGQVGRDRHPVAREACDDGVEAEVGALAEDVDERHGDTQTGTTGQTSTEPLWSARPSISST